MKVEQSLEQSDKSYEQQNDLACSNSVEFSIAQQRQINKITLRLLGHQGCTLCIEEMETQEIVWGGFNLYHKTTRLQTIIYIYARACD